jgi:very-short-patch-repair endonuclease
MNTEHPAFKDFSGRRIRNEADDRWLYSVVDFIQFATRQDNHLKARKYWNLLKKSLRDEGEPVVDKLICRKLLATDMKYYLTDVADLETLVELLRLIPSPNKAQLLQELGYEITRHRKEFAFGADIVENLFSEYAIIEQLPVLGGKYRIDWYIPELKLAIEYDESRHGFREKEDLCRQQAIEVELGCRFLRYKENFQRSKTKSKT